MQGPQWGTGEEMKVHGKKKDEESPVSIYEYDGEYGIMPRHFGPIWYGFRKR